MKWLKATGSAISVAFLAALAVFAVFSAQRQKAQARKWQGKAEDIEAGNVVKGIEMAEAASAQAKLHEARAKEKKAKAEQRITQIGEKNEDIASILDNWSKP